MLFVALKNFIAKGGRRCRLFGVYDATHDVSAEFMKLLGFGFAAFHWNPHHAENSVTYLPNMFELADGENTPAIRTLFKAAKSAALSEGIDLNDFLEAFFVDGKPEAALVIKEEFENTPIHLDLEHVKRNAAKRFPGGVGANVKRMLEHVAFLPDFLFHVTVEVILKKLRGAGRTKGVEYLVKNVFHLRDGLHSASWQASYFHVPPGYTAFVEQSLEANWRADDVAHGPLAAKAVASQVFEEFGKDCRVWYTDKKFDGLEHRPTMPTPHLLRSGKCGAKMMPKGCLYDKQFRIFNVGKMVAASAATKDFYIVLRDYAKHDRQPFDHIWVFCKQTPDHFDEASMLRIVDLYFAPDLASCERSFPMIDGARSYAEFRSLCAKFTVCGQLRSSGDSVFIDLHMDYMKKAESEHSRYLEHMHGADLGALGGAQSQQGRSTQRIAAVASRSASKRAEALLMTPERKKREDVHGGSDGTAQVRAPADVATGADSQRGPAPRRRSPAHAAASAGTSGGDGGAGADTGVGNAARREATVATPPFEVPRVAAPATPPASSTPAAGSGFLGGDVGDRGGGASASGDGLLDYHVQCDRCLAWRAVPKGVSDTFEGDGVKFYCRFGGAVCGKPKKKRRTTRSA